MELEQKANSKKIASHREKLVNYLRSVKIVVTKAEEGYTKYSKDVLYLKFLFNFTQKEALASLDPKDSY